MGINDSLQGTKPKPVAQQVQAPQSSSDAKPLNPFCEVDFHDDHEEFAQRIPFTEEEMDIINQGGNDCYGWEKITL